MSSISIPRISKSRSVLLDLTFIPIIIFNTLQIYIMIADYFGGVPYLRQVANSEQFRPWVYRALVPWTSQLLQRLTGVEAYKWLDVIVVASIIGLYFALKHLLTLVGRKEVQASVLAFAFVELFTMSLFIHAQVYDVPTALLFTLALIFLYRREYLNYALLFPLICLNRETTFLLTFVTVFQLIFWWKLSIPYLRYWSWKIVGLIAYQIVVYLLIRSYLIDRFASYPGDAFQWHLGHNLLSYTSAPIPSMLLFSIAISILYLTYKIRKSEICPNFFITAFWIIFPIQVILYLCLGLIWELRVFAESLPILAVVIPFGVEQFKLKGLLKHEYS